jgi:hypothetical protein
MIAEEQGFKQLFFSPTMSLPQGSTYQAPSDDVKGKVCPYVDATQPHPHRQGEKEMSPPGQQVIYFLTVRGCVNAHNNYVKKKSQPFDYEYESTGLTLRLHSQEAEESL